MKWETDLKILSVSLFTNVVLLHLSGIYLGYAVVYLDK